MVIEKRSRYVAKRLYGRDDVFDCRRLGFAGTVDTKPFDGYHQAVLFRPHHAFHHDAFFYMVSQLTTDGVINDAVSHFIVASDVDFGDVPPRGPCGGDYNAAN